MRYTDSVLDSILVYSLDPFIVDTIPSTCYQVTIFVARVTLDDYKSIGSILLILSQKEGAENMYKSIHITPKSCLNKNLPNFVRKIEFCVKLLKKECFHFHVYTPCHFLKFFTLQKMSVSSYLKEKKVTARSHEQGFI